MQIGASSSKERQSNLKRNVLERSALIERKKIAF
jgi:hypothetical protein